MKYTFAILVIACAVAAANADGHCQNQCKPDEEQDAKSCQCHISCLNLQAEVLQKCMQTHCEIMSQGSGCFEAMINEGSKHWDKLRICLNEAKELHKVLEFDAKSGGCKAKGCNDNWGTITCALDKDQGYCDQLKPYCAKTCGHCHDPCKANPCKKDEVCSNVDGEAQCTNPCESFACGKYAVCNVTNEMKPVCNCPKPMIGDPTKACGCPKGYFTCKNGQCIKEDLRCNGKPQCQDESDELPGYGCEADDSCYNKCGTYAGDYNCWCDNLCTGYGDCCDDFHSPLCRHIPTQ